MKHVGGSHAQVRGVIEQTYTEFQCDSASNKRNRGWGGGGGGGGRCGVDFSISKTLHIPSEQTVVILPDSDSFLIKDHELHYMYTKYGSSPDT